MKKWTFAAVLILAVAGTFLLKPVAHAIAGRSANQGYFTGNYSGSYNWDNVFTSAIPSGVNTKTEFINYVENQLAASGRDHLGAAFIINLMLGRNGSAADTSPGGSCTADGKNCVTAWEDRINNSTISIHRAGIQWQTGPVTQNCPYSNPDISGWNSAYDPGINDEVFYPDCGSHEAIYFTDQAGNIVFAVKTDCGNPIGDLAGLPSNADPTGSITPSCNSNGTMHLGYRYYDTDGSGDGNDTPAYTHVDTVTSRQATYTAATLDSAGWTFHGAATDNFASETLTTAKSDGGYTAWVYAKDVGPAGDGLYHQVDKLAINCDQPPTGSVNPTCNYSTGAGNVSLSFSDPDGSTTAVLTITYATGSTGTFNYATSGSYPTRAVSVANANGNWSAKLVVQDKGSGNLDKTYTKSQTDCSVTPPGFYPYFSVLGGDVAAGPGFGTGCQPGANSDITGNNIDTTGTGPFSGAGTQLAALALGDINSFATSQNANGSNAGAGLPSGLAFANDSTSTGGTRYGGSFTKAAWCVPDYVSNAAASTTPVPTPRNDSGPLSLTGLASGMYQWGSDGTPFTTNGGLTISASTLSNGQRLTLIVYGNVFINGNIMYSYATQPNIPQLRLLVSGNIYIYNANSSTGVNELHGFYDAQQASDGSGGTIYTCAPTMGTVSKAFATCNRQLFFYGGVSADKVELDRTFGNIKAASGTTFAPAEQFVYTPELWLGNLSTPSNTKQTVQSFTSLPPLL